MPKDHEASRRDEYESERYLRPGLHETMRKMYGMKKGSVSTAKNTVKRNRSKYDASGKLRDKQAGEGKSL